MKNDWRRIFTLDKEGDLQTQVEWVFTLTNRRIT